MIKRVVFFNYHHNGDVHVSRGFIRQIIQYVHKIYPDTQFAYAHVNDPKMLSDIPHLDFDPSALDIINDWHANLITINDTTYINTWFVQQHSRYCNRYDTTWDCLYAAFNDTCKELWGFLLSDISNDPSIFLPIIDYEKFEISHAKNWLHQNDKTKILVENGNCNSSQATNFPMAPIVINLANKYPEKIFILTQPANGYLPPNVIYSGNIIKKYNVSDLNEVSFLSTHCDMIIGRASGVFSFSLVQENLLQRNIKFLGFCIFTQFQNNTFWLHDLLRDKIKYSAKIIIHNEANVGTVQDIIDQHLKELP